MLTQFAIVIGIMSTQAMGLRFATPYMWRLVLLFSAALALAQLLAGPIVVESPVWLARHGLLRERDASARRLWKGAHAAAPHRADSSASDPRSPVQPLADRRWIPQYLLLTRTPKPRARSWPKTRSGPRWTLIGGSRLRTKPPSRCLRPSSAQSSESHSQ